MAIFHFFIVICLHMSYIVRRIINRHIDNGYIHLE